MVVLAGLLFAALHYWPPPVVGALITTPLLKLTMPVEVLGWPAAQRRRVVDAGAILDPAKQRHRALGPGRLEPGAPARLEKHVHIHCAAHVDVGRDQRHRRVARDIEALRPDGDRVHRHPRSGQAFDGVVGTAGIGDDAIVGVSRRFRPTLGMRRFVQGDRIDGDLHRRKSSFRPQPTGPAPSRSEDRLREEPESRSRYQKWIPAFAGITELCRIAADAVPIR